MLGYMNQNEATTETFDEDGWLLTGILMHLLL